MNDEAIYRHLMTLFRERGRAGESPEAASLRTLSWCQAHSVSILLPRDPELFRLNQIAAPPGLLFVLGERAILTRETVAVVGSRRPSAYGLRSALSFSRALSERGLCVASGLARGIDAAAHRAALDAGGTTVAVLAHGLDRIYPSTNAGLAREIVARGGCLVSEYAPGTPPLPHHFPERNRIISGLSLGVVVIEARPRSGSLITARHALEQNREVFVVPGAFDDPGFEGSHRLIQEGGKLVASVVDCLEEFPKPSVNGVPLDAELTELREIFRRHQGELRLGETDERESRALVPRLEAGKARGKVCEIYPQHFVWVGP